jgi:hypothetical protein
MLSSATWEDGSTVTTHDKGFSSCVVSIGGTQIEVTALHLIPYLRQLFARVGLAEVAIDEPTTPAGRRNDHILYRGLALKSKRIVSGVRTDHYPVIATFEVHQGDSAVQRAGQDGPHAW